MGSARPGRGLRSLARIVQSSLAPVIFLAVLVMGIVMLGPGRYHDGAAGMAACAIACAGLGWIAVTTLQRIAKRSSRRR